ncbi:hypothetical protein [Nonomuraea turkmeniaca]|nr:hypothetical protein [Nonomuraea turkmeniaca]
MKRMWNGDGGRCHDGDFQVDGAATEKALADCTGTVSAPVTGHLP